MTETKFGFTQFGTQTPMWAKYTFRIVAAISFVVGGLIFIDPSIPDSLKVRLLFYIGGFDKLILTLSKMFGVQPSEDESDENSERVIGDGTRPKQGPK